MSAERPTILLLGTLHTGGQRFGGDPEGPVWIAQREEDVIDVVSRLARFAPTRICIEVRPKDEARENDRFQAWARDGAALGTGEVHQFAFRLARLCGVDHLSGFDADWQLDWEGLRRLWPNERELEAAMRACASEADRVHEQVREMATSGASVGEILAFLNSAEYQDANHTFYVRMAELGDPSMSGGAEYTASWYLRNLRMYANLCRIAKPAERIFALVGIDHAKILNDLIRQGGRFEVADPLEFLR